MKGSAPGLAVAATGRRGLGLLSPAPRCALIG